MVPFGRRKRRLLAEGEGLLAQEHPDQAGVALLLPELIGSRWWEVRNVAVKLIGKGRVRDFYHVLSSKLLDRREAGIVRRNCAEAIGRIGEATDVFRRVLKETLSDRYWEVRAESARAISLLFGPDADLEEALLEQLGGLRYLEIIRGPVISMAEKLGEENFEVRGSIAQALGAVGQGDMAYRALVGLTRDRSWPVRNQAVVALVEFASRNPAVFASAVAWISHTDLTCDGAASRFVLREHVRELLEAMKDEGGGVSAAKLRAGYIDFRRGWHRL